MEELADIFRVLRYHGLEFYSDLSIPANVTDSNCISRLRCIFTRCCFTVFHPIPLTPFVVYFVRTFILERPNWSIFFQSFLQSTDPNLLFTYFSKHSFILLRIIKNIYLNFNWPIDSDTLLYHNVVIKLFKCRNIIKEKINIQKEINFFDDARSISRKLKREKKKGGQKKKKNNTRITMKQYDLVWNLTDSRSLWTVRNQNSLFSDNRSGFPTNE